jgi:hypothetical protein
LSHQQHHCHTPPYPSLDLHRTNIQLYPLSSISLCNTLPFGNLVMITYPALGDSQPTPWLGKQPSIPSRLKHKAETKYGVTEYTYFFPSSFLINNSSHFRYSYSDLHCAASCDNIGLVKSASVYTDKMSYIPAGSTTECTP